MKQILGLLFLLMSTTVKAQFLEKIYLKDSITTYTGWVVEQVPAEYLKLVRQKEKDTVTINSNQIWRIVRVLDTKSSNPFYFNPKPFTGLLQSVYLEGGGSAFLYSFNYDRRLKRNKRDGWGLRAGFGIVGADFREDSVSKVGRITLFMVPLQINYLFGAKRSAWELGLGVTPLFATGVMDTANNYYFENFKKKASTFYPCPSAVIGYRYTSLNNGVTFRVALTPSVVYGEFIMGAGISIGYSFATKKKR